MAADLEPDRWERERRLMIEEIEEEVRLTERWTGKAPLDPRVMEAMANVPRHSFVPPGETGAAYFNQPLPIGHGQTISQPYIVAMMTALLEAGPDDVVLEVGTGSGYQAAVLSQLVKKLYTIELVPDLAQAAAERLARLGYANVEVRAGNGAEGWPEHAPFDGIIVTAAAREIPQALVDQLKPGAKMVIPVGDSWGQQLMVVEKDGAGEIETRAVLPVAFVPLIANG